MDWPARGRGKLPKREDLAALREAGVTRAEIAAHYGASGWRVYQALVEHGLATRIPGDSNGSLGY